MFSCCFKGCLLELAKLEACSLSQIHSYLNHSRLLLIRIVVNGWLEVNIKAPLPIIKRLYCVHNLSKGIMESQAAYVVPYGKSVITACTDWSGKVGKISRQSPR